MKLTKKIAVLLVVIALPALSFAQCSVCAAGLASSQQAGSHVALGINNGILYLLAFPYVIGMGFVSFQVRDGIAYRYRMLVQRWRMFKASH